MEFRKSTESDIDEIMKIIRQAQVFLRTLGVDQWQNNYPNAESIRSDVERGNSYVLLKNKKIAATAAISFDGEKTYGSIYEGQWVTDQAYAVLHRIVRENLVPVKATLFSSGGEFPYGLLNFS